MDRSLNKYYYIYETKFICQIRELLNSQPKLFILMTEDSVGGLLEYYRNMLNHISDKYNYIFNQKDSNKLICDIEKFTYEERIEIYMYFKLKSHFNRNLEPSIRNFCRLLKIEKNTSLEGIRRKLLKSDSLVTDKLKYRFNIKCTNCDQNNGVVVEYMGGTRFTGYNICCKNCKHRFLLKVDNRQLSKRDVIANYLCYDELINCECDSCLKWKENLKSFILNNKDSFREELLNIVYNKEVNNEKNITLEQMYKIHKNSLTKSENQLLDLKPKSYKEIKILLEEISYGYKRNMNKSKTINNLIKHGVIYSLVDKEVVKDKIEEYLNKYSNLIDDMNLRKILYIGGGVSGLNPNDILPPYSIDYILDERERKWIYLCRLDICFSVEFRLNEYYFRSETPDLRPQKKYSIFNSNAECTLYKNLSRIYNNHIISVNVPLRVFVNVDNLIGCFDKKQLNYLKYCIIDFVISDIDGSVIKCIELQKGEHHNEEVWIDKDNLKRECFLRLGIPFSYEY